MDDKIIINNNNAQVNICDGNSIMNAEQTIYEDGKIVSKSKIIISNEENEDKNKDEI